jgi:hypothetical protein
LEHASRIYEESAQGSIQELDEASKGVVTNVDHMSIYASDLLQAVRKSAGDKGTSYVNFWLIFSYYAIPL